MIKRPWQPGQVCWRPLAAAPRDKAHVRKRWQGEKGLIILFRSMADAVPAVGVMVEGANALGMFVAFKDCLRQMLFIIPSRGRMIETTRQRLPLR